MYSVYICEDFEIGNNILTIYDAKEIGKVEDIKGFNRLNEKIPNAIICPELFHNREQFNIIIFEY